MTLDKLKSLVEMAAGLAERLHRREEAKAYNRVLEMIDDIEGESATVCVICGQGLIVDGRCEVCGMRFEEVTDE